MISFNILGKTCCITLIVATFALVGCETEQTNSKNNDAMVGYAQEHAKAQAEFANQEQLKKSSLAEVQVVTDGTPQPLNAQP
ncbi:MULTISPECIES: hypothetical protein [Acinetobacter]|uniref:Lipoprotein n=1 Tax=Acinetobacter corruptisaponis TaxID=3045147 RepID=A0ABY8S4M7_9GAMM|nr:hypothetical protein [Acinetobacter sp. KCTC 92772]WHP06658.1 hypothetical protein QLH32_04085 [Acinetobacter sp. KCTC 92772]